MLLSKLIGERYKERPAEANTASHIFLLRGGYIRPVTSGVYSLLPLGRKITQKIETIIRQEMNALDGQEVLFPVVMPRELWDESGRYESIGDELLRFTDRNKREMLLGMTHEEAAVHMAKSEVKTYAKYPFMIYQIQTKFRDEARPRAGLVRTREFTMKDAYSFHTSQKDLEEYYKCCLRSYHKIFKRVGLRDVIAVKSDTGMMGGSVAHEFMFLCDSGEDSIVLCESCGYSANVEACEVCAEHSKKADAEKVKRHTPDIKTIDDLSRHFGVSSDNFIKAAVFAVEKSERPVVVFIRGDYELNEAKLKNIIKANIFPLNHLEASGLEFGFIGPCSLPADGVDIYFDATLEGCKNMICGANEKDYHFSGISFDRDFTVNTFVDVAKINPSDPCPFCGKPISIRKGIETGNIFQLGTKYTKSMDMTYANAFGENEYPIMGCYGIGVGRLMACLVEQNHDEWGPVWPMSVAPFEVHICAFNMKNEEVRQKAFELYETLSADFDVLLDDRAANTGVQLADADLIGAPLRVIVSTRNLANNELEILTRDKKIKENIKIDDAVEYIAKLKQSLL